MPTSLARVTVPNVIGLRKGDAEQRLTSVPLRFIAKGTFSATGDGTAAAQTPVAGTIVLEFSVVTVDYPNPIDDTEGPVDGPVPQNGPLEGTITGVFVGRDRAGIAFSLDDSIPPFSYDLYHDADPTTREGYMRRGALLALAQRAYTGKDKVIINFGDRIIQGLWILR
jgi:hypothetical protein